MTTSKQALRANYIQLFNIHAYLYDEFEWWNTDFHYYSDTTLHFILLEPTVTLKGGGEKWKGLFQFGLTVPTINADSYFMVYWRTRGFVRSKTSDASIY
ncbi:MAG: hypothetical protein J5I98_02200 [Phaeodactylibacter sp.]|nr:hypothetical protein [Phaeodactylibacter sp.]